VESFGSNTNRVFYDNLNLGLNSGLQNKKGQSTGAVRRRRGCTPYESTRQSRPQRRGKGWKCVVTLGKKGALEKIREGRSERGREIDVAVTWDVCGGTQSHAAFLIFGGPYLAQQNTYAYERSRSCSMRLSRKQRIPAGNTVKLGPH